MTTTVCTVDTSSGAISIVGAGDCIVRANQAGNRFYLAAPQATQTVLIELAEQVIDFPTPADHELASGAFELTASGGDSGNPVQFISLSTEVCSTSGNAGATLTPLAVGTCTVRARQVGNSNYLSAPDVERSFQISGSLPDSVFHNGFEAPMLLTVGGEVSSRGDAN
jgi:hypothetical protein